MTRALHSHCPNGHELTEENTVSYGGKRRRHCLTCRKARRERYRNNLKEQGRVGSPRCKAGHAYDPDNTEWERHGERWKRRCLQCKRERQAGTYGRRSDRMASEPWREQYPRRPEGPIHGQDVAKYEPAMCVGEPLGDFFPADREGEAPKRRHKEAAERLCAHCPIRRMCDADATKNRDVGLFGGKWRSMTRGYQVVDLLHPEFPGVDE